MVLRLEHVEHVRAERLRRLHDERAGRIVLAADLERGASRGAPSTPVLISALTNLVAVGKSGWSAGMM